MKKYYSSKAEAKKACSERQKHNPGIGVYKMPKGSRHAGQYAVCDHIEYLNTY